MWTLIQFIHAEKKPYASYHNAMNSNINLFKMVQGPELPMDRLKY